jgi:molybdate transport system ATP-binding protein
MKPIGGLSLDSLVIGYAQPLQDPVSINISPGEILAVLGPSGCGKSTLLATIAGVIPQLGGSISIDGRRVDHLPIHERKIGVVFQEPLLFPHLSIIDNIAYGLRARGVNKAVGREIAAELLDWVGLSAIKDQRTWEISGGQAGRIALARALASEPAALLFDEPYSALDSVNRLRIAQEVAEILREKKIPAIHVTHDPLEAESLATNTLIFN